ncbi:DUF2987 domain-containing protein [Neiella marina]|uniref:DUF2987 domain-containing protein n=1 Tax=Neiella holothuriorum TaxID=2870530 RepID=A0ABS7EH26_9GAMM|nr:DUF2987 domain-containing protein [Neiella holothuriorum]MBW8191519.1 DUF2987 domain-containing protein [Neiella holothuriorum]
MNRTVGVLLSAIGLICSMTSAQAAELNLQYAGFYDYLKQANDPEFNQVRPAFFLSEQGKTNGYCLAGATIKAGNASYPVVTNPVTGEFFVPFDKRIKDQRGLLVFDAPETCQLQVAVVGKIHQQQISQGEMLSLAAQIYQLMKEYAGSVSFMMPDWSAVIIVFENGEQQSYLRNEIPQDIKFDMAIDHVRLAMINN